MCTNSVYKSIVKKALVGFLAEVEFDQGLKWNLQYTGSREGMALQKNLRQDFDFWLSWVIWSQTGQFSDIWESFTT